ncbi:MAG: MoaD/ThiS family protein [Planctomycetota bacterium]|jgi:molybdopterin converting factor small subunit
MSVTVRLWAGVKEAAGQAELSVDGATVAEVRAALAAAVPAVAERLAYCRYALDDTFVAEDAAVADGATVDVIPPVSGG